MKFFNGDKIVDIMSQYADRIISTPSNGIVKLTDEQVAFLEEHPYAVPSEVKTMALDDSIFNRETMHLRVMTTNRDLKRLSTEDLLSRDPASFKGLIPIEEDGIVNYYVNGNIKNLAISVSPLSEYEDEDGNVHKTYSCFYAKLFGQPGLTGEYTVIEKKEVTPEPEDGEEKTLYARLVKTGDDITIPHPILGTKTVLAIHNIELIDKDLDTKLETKGFTAKAVFDLCDGGEQVIDNFNLTNGSVLFTCETTFKTTQKTAVSGLNRIEELTIPEDSPYSRCNITVVVE